MDFKMFLESTAPRISDPDALDRIARVEGEPWKKLQQSRQNSAQGFFAYLRAWQALEKEGYVGELSPSEAINMDLVPGVRGADGAIYGEGGYTRYRVDRQGVIHFDYGLARKEKQQKAKQEGFPP